MTAPDLDDLERSLHDLEGDIDCLATFAENGGNVSLDADMVFWLIRVMSRDLDGARAWLDTVHEANKAAKGNGPRAVS